MKSILTHFGIFFIGIGLGAGFQDYIYLLLVLLGIILFLAGILEYVDVIDEDEFDIGETVMCVDPGSWIDGQIGVIIGKDAVASDGAEGYSLQIGKATSVAPKCCLRKLNKKETNQHEV